MKIKPDDLKWHGEINIDPKDIFPAEIIYRAFEHQCRPLGVNPIPSIVYWVYCKKDIQKNKELHEYLLSIKEKAEKNNYVGFSFVKESS